MKTEFKHTPGIFCKAGRLGTWCPPCKRLLSAAPELLEAARSIAKHFPYTGNITSAMADRLTAAIAKADGEGL